MTTHTLLRAALLLAFPLCASALPAATLAQEADGIIIALPDEFPEADVDAFALVITESERTIVVLRRTDLNPNALEAALRIAARDSEEGLEPGTSSVSVVSGFAMKTEMERAHERTLDRVIAALEHAPESSLGGLGRGRWVRWTNRGR